MTIKPNAAAELIEIIAERDRLRKALQEISDGDTAHGRTDFSHADILQNHYRIARNALEKS